MNSFHLYIISSLIGLMLLSCDEKIEKPFLFSVADQKVTIEQAQLSYAFNPYLYKIKDSMQAKKSIVSALIAQQLLAAEAEKAGLQDTTIFSRIRAHKREAIIEKFRTDSIEKTIEISEEELKDEYSRALQEIEIAFFALDENGNKLQSKEKLLTWPIQNQKLEETVYSMEEGQESGELKSGTEVFKIKILKITHSEKMSPKGFRNRKPALLDHIRRRKIRQTYTSLFYDRIEPVMGTVNQVLVDQVAEHLSLKIKAPVRGQSGLFGSQKELPQVFISEIRFEPENIFKQAIVSFPSGEVWSTEKLLNILKYGPYAFNFSNPQLFKKSFNYNINLLLEHQAIYSIALDRDYNEQDQIIRDMEMWRNYYQANTFRYELLAKQEENYNSVGSNTQNDSEMDVVRQKRLEYMDQLLVKLLKKNKVTINTSAYITLNPPKTDMVLMKSHFAHRQVVPPLELLGGLTGWEKEMDELLNKYGTQ